MEKKMNQRERDALDNFITGHYGEDQNMNEDQPYQCGDLKCDCSNTSDLCQWKHCPSCGELYLYDPSDPNQLCMECE